MYGHIQKLAEEERKGIESVGGKADIFQWVTSGWKPTVWLAV